MGRMSYGCSDVRIPWIFECDGLFSFLVNFIFHNRHSEFYGIRISRHQLKSFISRDIDVLRLPFFYQSKAESQGFRLVKEWASEDINISRYGRFEFGIINLHFEGSNLWIWFKIVTIRWNSIQMSISITKFHDSDTKLESPISRDIDVLRRPFFHQSKALTLNFR